MTYNGKGYWLIRYDGTKTPVYDYIVSLISSNNQLADKIGSNHVGGCYNFTHDCYVKEGADKIKEIGSHVIKLWIINTTWGQISWGYPCNCNWDSLIPGISTTTDILKHPNFQAVLNDPNFKTIVFEAENTDVLWYDGYTKDFAGVKNAMYEAAKYLLTNYKYTNKTFIFQSWEGDWRYIPPGSDLTSQPQIVKDSMIAWFNARQEGVIQARNEIGENGVRVMCAAEVNLISTLLGREHIIDVVIPYTHMDIYSYSCYETADPIQLTENLDYIASHSPDDVRYGFGNKNVYIGEFGCAEYGADIIVCYNRMKNVIDTSLTWGAQYLLYWQIYDNECVKKTDCIKDRNELTNVIFVLIIAIVLIMTLI